MILFTGRGTAGSWKIRGEQLGGAVGTAKPNASYYDFVKADKVVMVKRPAPGQINELQRAGTWWAWDLVDFYPQPQATAWNRERAIKWARDQITKFQPNAVIWPNYQMRDDCDPGCEIPGFVLPHHHRPFLKLKPIPDKVKVIGYEGNPKYLGEWHKTIAKACEKRGIQFRVDGRVDEYDIAVAFRGHHCNGYVQSRWKSNVKQANAHGAGVPLICAPEASYIECESGEEIFVRHPGDFEQALEKMLCPKRRRVAMYAGWESRLSLGRIADVLATRLGECN